MKKKMWNFKRKMLIMLIVFVCGIQLTWASDLELSSKVGISGQYKSNRSIPIAVTVTNSKDDFTGEVQVELKNSGKAYSQMVNVAGGNSQTVIIPIDNVDNNYTSVEYRLLDRSGKIIEEKNNFFSQW